MEKFSLDNCLSAAKSVENFQFFTKNVDAFSLKVQKYSKIGSHAVQVLQFVTFPLDRVIAAVAYLTFPTVGHFLNLCEAKDAKDLAGRILLTPINLTIILIPTVVFTTLYLPSVALTPIVGIIAVINGGENGERKRAYEEERAAKKQEEEEKKTA